MHVEDHPIEYGTFEGTIPESEYGGGTVMLWDQGWWEPVGEPGESYQAGTMRFRLHGRKPPGRLETCPLSRPLRRRRQLAADQGQG